MLSGVPAKNSASVRNFVEVDVVAHAAAVAAARRAAAGPPRRSSGRGSVLTGAGLDQRLPSKSISAPPRHFRMAGIELDADVHHGPRAVFDLADLAQRHLVGKAGQVNAVGNQVARKRHRRCAAA